MNRTIEKPFEASTGLDTQRETGGWYFCPISIVCATETPEQAKDLQDIVGGIIERDAKNGTELFENRTDIEKEDELLDELLGVEAYNCKHSLTGYLADLKRYNVVGNKGAFLNPDFTRLVFTAVKICADTIKDNTECPNKVKNRIADIIKTFDTVPVWGLFFQILTLQGVCHILENVNINEGESGYDEAANLQEWIIWQLIEKETGFCFGFYGDDDLILLRPFCEYLCTTPVGQLVQQKVTGHGIIPPEVPEQPREFDTEKARALISMAVEAGFITVEAGQYKWNGEKVLLAYFAVKASTYLGLKMNYNAKACWKPFESLFNVINLKGAKADFEKYHSDFHPTGYEDIDTLFEADTEGQK